MALTSEAPFLYTVVIFYSELAKGHAEDTLQQKTSSNDVSLSESNQSDVNASP